MTRSLDCGCQLTLMCCACTCNSSRKNLPCFRNILAQFCRILVIDYVILPTEDTDLLLSVKCSSALERLAACCLCIRHNQILHKSSVFRMSIHFCGLLSWIPHAVPEHAAVSDHIKNPHPSIERELLINSVRNVHETVNGTGCTGGRTGILTRRRVLLSCGCVL